jgi:3-oxoacyl-[acyl-carrier protein] reductase
MMLPGYSIYAASKGAVDQITRVLAKELGSRHITVNAVAPGPVDTELFRDGKSDEQIQQMAQMAALGRIGEVQDIADAVAFLAGDDARWITGQIIHVNGGFT